MPLLDLAVLAAVRGFAEAVGVSASGAEAAANVVLAPMHAAVAVDAALAFGAAIALGVSARRRVVETLSESVRAIARPALFRDRAGGRDALLFAVALAVSCALHAALAPLLSPWTASPLAAGLGLVATGVGVASTAAAPRGTLEAPSLLGAIAVGAVHGAAGCPGASRLAAALTMLVWLGVRPQRAVEFALVMTCVVELATATLSAGSAGQGADFAAVALAVALAFVAAAAGAAVLRALAVKHRLATLAFAACPLGIALLAYARALAS